MLAIKFILLLFSVFVGYILGFIFTEDEDFRLSRFRLFQFQAFECRKCLSTHIAWVTSTLISLIFEDWLMLIIGLVFAAALFTGLYIDEKNKIIDLDDYDDFKGRQ